MPETSSAVQMSDARRTLAFLTLSAVFRMPIPIWAAAGCLPTRKPATLCCSGLTFAKGNGALRCGIFCRCWPLRPGCMPQPGCAGGRPRGAGCTGGRPCLRWKIVLLAAVGFMPPALDLAANVLVSFSCAMQVQAFRKLRGTAYASTMCIGNLRSAMQALYEWRHGEAEAGLRAAQYFGMLALFALGRRWAGC